MAIPPETEAQILRYHHAERWPIGTIVRGRRVMWDGELVTASTGRPILFTEALPKEA